MSSLERESRPPKGPAPEQAAKLANGILRRDPTGLRLAPGPAGCYPEHVNRLTSAGLLGCCPDHGCPLCGPDVEPGCWPCTALGLALYAIEWPETRRDPYCLFHGVPSPESYGSCDECDRVMDGARLWGWEKPTGHDGEDCLHCTVCGKCKATGAVCRVCWRCLDHIEDRWGYPTDECWRVVWSRSYRQEVPFHTPDVWDPVTRRWDPLPEHAS